MAFIRDTSDPRTWYKAKQWHPKALLIQSMSDKMYKYINELKINLKNETGIKVMNGTEFWQEEDFNAVTNLFQKKEKGEELKMRIMEYKVNVLKIDQTMDSVFRESVNKTISVTDSNHNNQKTFTETFFSNIPAIAALAVLQKFENDIRNLEVQLINYCYNQIPR